MTTINQIQEFAGNAAASNMLDVAAYLASPLRLSGHVPGLASQALENAVLRNLSRFNRGLAEFIARNYAAGVVDDGDVEKVVAGMTAAIVAVLQKNISISAASETVAGILKLATAAQALAGTDTATAMTPADAASAINAVVSAAMANVAKLNVAQGWTRQQNAVLVMRTGQSGSQAVDLDLHQALMVTATAPIIMAAPDHMVAGRTCLLLLYAASAQTISWASAWHGTSLASLPTALVAGKLLAVSFLCVTTDAGTYMVPVGTIQEA